MSDAMRKNRLTQILFLGIAAAALVAGAMVRGPLEAERKRGGLADVTTDASVAQRPHIAVLQIAPGGLRVIALNYLWIRSQQLKDDGRLYDAKQVRELICDLMPYYSGAWNFMAWDMSWNISVATHTPQERWMWVRNGITLLRDRGLIYNPNDLLMHKQIAWTFSSKIGGYTDEMHRQYKWYWAEEIDRILGSPPPTGSTKDAIDAFRLVADAPQDRAALKPGAAAFLTELADLGVQPDDQLLVYYNRYSDDPRRGQAILLARDPEVLDKKKLAKVTALMADPAREADRAEAVAFTRRKVLVESFRMDPAWMLALMVKYGPLDWRSVHPHAIYWATLGLFRSQGLTIADLKPGVAEAEIRTGERERLKDGRADDAPFDYETGRLKLDRINRVNTERIILGSLKSLTRTGQIYYRRVVVDRRSGKGFTAFDWGPDWRYIVPAAREYEAGGYSLVGKGGDLTDDANVLRQGQITYLSDAVLLLHVAGRKQEAQEYYDKLVTQLKPEKPEYKLAMVEFCQARLPQAVSQTFDLARAFRHGALVRTYRALALGNMAEYRKYRAYARKIYANFKTSIGKAPRFGVREFEAEEADLLYNMMLTPEVVGLRLSLLTKSTIYRAIEPKLQRMIYRLIAPAMRRQCRAEKPKIDFNRAFPRPGAGLPPNEGR